MFYSRKCLLSVIHEKPIDCLSSEIMHSGCIYLSQLFLTMTDSYHDKFSQGIFSKQLEKLKHVFAWLHMIGSRSVSKRWRAIGKFPIKSLRLLIISKNESFIIKFFKYIFFKEFIIMNPNEPKWNEILRIN